jgi:hypothetical protein
MSRLFFSPETGWGPRGGGLESHENGCRYRRRQIAMSLGRLPWTPFFLSIFFHINSKKKKLVARANPRRRVVIPVQKKNSIKKRKYTS